MNAPQSRVPARLEWRDVPIVAIRTVTPRVKSFTLETGWEHPYRAGQHVDVRLTASDGYQAQRSYSMASAPTEGKRIEIMVERLEGGEVSGFFHDVAESGDNVELRGPIGLPFSWAPQEGGPLLLIGGGSGVVPLLLLSARSAADAICRDELERRAATEPGFALTLVLTREPSVPGTTGRRIDRALLAEALARLGTPARAFVCGANGFVGAMADLLVDGGLKPETIRTERFG